MKKLRIGIVIIFLVSVFGQIAGAAIIQVPADYPGLRQAIVAAEDGDEVVVSPGTYYEHNINFQCKILTVRSIDPTDHEIVESTIIDGQGEGSVFNLYMQAENDSVLSGLTIRNGHAGEGKYFGGGISCMGTSPTITNNIIENNSASYGGGISCNESEAVIINNTIRNNYAEQFGGGIHCSNSTATITGNIITGNRSIFYGGGINTMNGEGYDPSLIDSNTITLNRSDHGAGISCYDAVISNNYIADNIGEPDGPCAIVMGGGIYGSPSVIAGNTILNNTADWGGGIHITGNTSEITGNLISNNFAVMHGGGLDFRSGIEPVVEHNTIFGNRSEQGAGIACYFGTFYNNVISMNEGFSDDPEARSMGGGIYVGDISECNGTPPNFVNNTIDGNTADDGGNIYISLSSPIIKNCIITNAQSGGGIFRDNSGGDSYQPVISFCNLFQNQGNNYVGINDLTGSQGNASVDPLFADPADSDYHLLSEGGRWTGTSWVEDNVTSPCIDRGDPSSDYSLEPAPNGERINMGALGNTMEASLSNQGRLIRILVYEIAEWVHPLLQKAYPDAVYVEAAGDSRQIIQMLEQEPFDAVLIDTAIPEKEGLNTAMLINESKPISKYQDIVLIGFSKENIKGGLDICLKAGMDDYVSTPEADQLIDVIKKRLKEMQNNDGSDLIRQPSIL